MGIRVASAAVATLAAAELLRSARACAVREDDGDLVVIVAVVGLADPQRQLRHVFLRHSVTQVAVRVGEVRAGDGDLVVIRAVVVAS